MRIGIDLGGTKTEIICLDKANGKELYRQRIPTPRGDYKDTLKSIVDLVKLAEKTVGRKGSLGIGIPGAMSVATGLVKNANTTWLIGKPLQKDLEDALSRPVRIENDANCFAVSEASDGAAEGRRVVFGVIIGTGCGGGLAIDGVAHRGLNAIAGEWGHNPLPYQRVWADHHEHRLSHFERFETAVETLDSYFSHDEATNEHPGPLCYCGRRGCLETWISGTGFKNDYARVTGAERSTHDIIADVKNGDDAAIRTLERYTDRLARALANVINILDPDAIVLGGGMSNVASLYKDVPQVWGKYVFSDSVKTPLLQARHGDSSGVRGAAWLWSRDEG
ncbi:MAG: ROK family protein [Alphaproteobacteria bacterium]|nr:ROK family protein [Alphaproteobacteria bacterium]